MFDFIYLFAFFLFILHMGGFNANGILQGIQYQLHLSVGN